MDASNFDPSINEFAKVIASDGFIGCPASCLCLGKDKIIGSIAAAIEDLPAPSDKRLFRILSLMVELLTTNLVLLSPFSARMVSCMVLKVPAGSLFFVLTTSLLDSISSLVFFSKLNRFFALLLDPFGRPPRLFGSVLLVVSTLSFVGVVVCTSLEKPLPSSS